MIKNKSKEKRGTDRVHGQQGNQQSGDGGRLLPVVGGVDSGWEEEGVEVVMVVVVRV